MRTPATRAPAPQTASPTRADEQSDTASAPDPRLGHQFDNIPVHSSHARAREENPTGLPDELKANLERASGLELSAMRVRRNSDKPSKIAAHAYTQGTEIHLAPGQERHLAHEAWHVVQQLQGRVRPLRTLETGAPVNDDPALEHEADTMGAALAPSGSFAMSQGTAPAVSTTSPASAPIQGAWATVQGTGERLNLTTLKGETSPTGKQLYKHSGTGDMYEEVSNSAVGGLEVKPYAAVPSFKFGSSVRDAYEDWETTQTTGLPLNTQWGPVTARHHRGAPYAQSQAKDYGNAALSDTYASYVSGLRNNKKDTSQDALVAADLLKGTDDNLLAEVQKRAASMLEVTVGLAEEWRKQGAAKIFRALLRQVESGELTLDECIERFAYVASADKGRRQVGRMQDVQSGDMDVDDLPDEEQEIYNNMSPLRDDDLSSDDELRDKKQLSKKRLFAKKHQTKDK